MEKAILMAKICENDYELWDTMGYHGIFIVFFMFFSGILQTQRVAGHLVTSPVQIYNFASKASMAEAVTLKAGQRRDCDERIVGSKTAWWFEHV